MKKRSGWKGSRYQDDGGSQQASSVFNIKNELIYLNPDYDLEIFQDNQITKQGLLLCGTLTPKHSSSLPEFWIRWDEKAGTLDVDIHGKRKIKRDWNKEQNGYQGHHPEKLEIEGRHYKILINIPQLKIFEGVLSFNLNREVKSNVSLGVSVNVNVISSANPKIERWKN